MTIPYLLLFLLPTQLAFHFWPSWAFVFGIRVDFLSPAFYLTDLLAIILIFTNLSIYKKYTKHILALILFASVNILFSTSPPESFYRWLKIFEMIAIGIYFAKSKIASEKVFKTLFYSAILFSLVGIVQFIKGGTTGLFYVLGERSFNSTTPGIALISISGQLFLRAYSTFSHPNSLAGYLGIILILFLDFKKRRAFDILGALVIASGFILSFSLTAFIGLIVVFVLKYLFTKKNVLSTASSALFYLSFFVSLALPIFVKNISLNRLGFGQNLSQRLDLSLISGKMIAEKFLIGEGLNTFIVNIPRFRGMFSYSWLLQPVHNIFLLMFSELGILGALTLFFIFNKALHTKFALVFLFVVITGFMDHYWLTLQQNILLVSILLGLSARIKEWKTA